MNGAVLDKPRVTYVDFEDYKIQNKIKAIAMPNEGDEYRYILEDVEF